MRREKKREKGKGETAKREEKWSLLKAMSKEEREEEDADYDDIDDGDDVDDNYDENHDDYDDDDDDNVWMKTKRMMTIT